MMVAEIIGGLWYGSVALVADGLHMSTHAGALLIAALAYTYSRRPRLGPTLAPRRRASIGSPHWRAESVPARGGVHPSNCAMEC
jgi:hypothetical protein